VSGAELIGAVPAHWSVKPLRLVGRLLKGTGGSKEDIVEEGVPCVRYGDLYTTHNNFIEEARSYLTEERAQDYTPIEYGDVLFAASGETIEEIGKSAVNLLHGARCGGDVVILRPSEPTVARFLGYATDAAPVAAQKSLAGRGTTVKHIYPDELREIVIAVPPFDEQQAIADFLDRETARLDALVTAKQRLLDLLAEKRKAIIATAVTRGVDSMVRLRDSGVHWLGEIPKHWQAKRLRHISPAITVGVVVNPSTYITDDGVPFLYGSDITEEGIRIDGARRLDPEVSRTELAKTCLRPGDIVTVRVGAPGVTAVVPPKLDGANCASVMLVRGAQGMFVARVSGRSMEPMIPDGVYCLFRAPVEGTRQGKIVLVELRDQRDAETGERYTVKRYASEKTEKGDSWHHERITLKPLNPEFEPSVLTGNDEGEFRVVAELVDVLGSLERE
jgi:type I restriction enzyme, S subunit